MALAKLRRPYNNPLLVREGRGMVLTPFGELAAADQLGYSPNRAARGLVTGKTGNVWILVPDIINPFYPPVVKGATDRASAAGASVFIATIELDPRQELKVARELIKQVDGLVLCATQLADGDVARLAETCAGPQRIRVPVRS